MSAHTSENLEQLPAQIRQAKLEWETTVDALPQVVCLLDEGGHVLRANRAVERWGYGRVQDAKGQELHELIHPDCHDADCAFKKFWCAAWDKAAMGQVTDAEIDDLRAMRYLHVQVNPLKHARQQEQNGSGNFAAVIIHDITERKRAEQERERLLAQVRAGREQLQSLSRRMLEVQENERRHIARELHDDIGQDLTAAKINLQALQRVSETALPHVEDSIAIVERALQQVRNLSLELRPSMLDDLGLIPALRWYIGRTAQRAGLEAEFSNQLGNARLPPEIETTCFRITQAALMNTVKHAHADRVSVRLGIKNSELYLTIRDNGIGFDVDAARRQAIEGNSLGILSMEERVFLAGGRIEIESALGHGTEIRVSFPYTEGST